MARILVIGGSGQVGSALCRAAMAAGHEVVATAFANPSPGQSLLDIADVAAVRTFVLDARADWVFCPGGMTNVEACEERPDEARRVNVEGPLAAAQASIEAGCGWFCAFSSEYVFDGADGPYAEGDPVSPLSVYGQTKLEMERSLLALPFPILAVRTTVVYGHEPQGKNFVCQLLRAAREGRTLPAPADQRSSPTYNEDLASALLELAARRATGLLHVAGPEVLARSDFARLACEVFGLPLKTFRPVATAELHQKARRPLRAGLKVERALGMLERTRLRPPREGLSAMRAALERESPCGPIKAR